MSSKSMQLLPELGEACPRNCVHCGNPVPRRSSAEFCCTGCETVYRWIQGRHLGKYYDIKNRTSSLRKSAPVAEAQEAFRYLDDPEFLKLYSVSEPDGRSMEFYLEGVHCVACVWLTEKVADIVDHVRSIRLNLGSSIAIVKIDRDGSFAAVALELQRMGYRPHPIQKGERMDFQDRENRRLLIRLGVAAACAGNIMLLAVSLYGGARGSLGEVFRWISFGLFLPVILFSAVPFYQSAWNAIRVRQISIDIPVVFGILLGSFVSVFNLLSGDERVYFDSLSSLVFLLLATRYLLKRTQQAAFSSSQLQNFLTPAWVKKWNSDSQCYEEARLNEVVPGDRIRVLPGECIPVDGLVANGSSSIDCALLTGESHPQPVAQGALAFAGTRNIDGVLEIEVTQSGSKTRVGRILDSMEKLLTRKARITVFSDQVSRYFVAAVLVLSVFVFVLGVLGSWAGGWEQGLNRALAVSIVTCPCTFALITPLVFSMTLGKLAKSGILVKGPDVLEKIAQARTIFLDKTGTLTFGEPRVVQWQAPQTLFAAVLAIESQSNHPIAKALVRYLEPKVSDALPRVQDLKETLGQGIRAKVGGNWIELRRAKEATGAATEISVFENDQFQGRIVLSDTARPESKETVDRLRRIGMTPWILSGDHPVTVTEVARGLGISAENCIAEASPEQKAKHVRAARGAVMVGDGANDAIALAQADVGIAVHGGVEISLRAADVYIRMPGVRPVYELVVIARESLRVVRRNLVFSVFYNLAAGALAVAGKINPLTAAVLMPLSALTVFLSSIAGTREMKRAFREISR